MGRPAWWALFWIFSAQKDTYHHQQVGSYCSASTNSLTPTSVLSFASSIHSICIHHTAYHTPRVHILYSVHHTCHTHHTPGAYTSHQVHISYTRYTHLTIIHQVHTSYIRYIHPHQAHTPCTRYTYHTPGIHYHTLGIHTTHQVYIPHSRYTYHTPSTHTTHQLYIPHTRDTHHTLHILYARYTYTICL